MSKALLSPFALAIIPALLLLYFLPLKFEKYEATLLTASKIGQSQPLFIEKYVDLDGDDNPEKIKLGSRYDIDSSLYYRGVL